MWYPVTRQESLDEAENLPAEPRKELCVVCSVRIGDEDWGWAAMAENGPVHQRCFMTDEQLLAELTDRRPCTGCDTTCKDYAECVDFDVLHYANGVDNCVIVRPGMSHVAESFRAQGQKVVGG